MAAAWFILLLGVSPLLLVHGSSTARNALFVEVKVPDEPLQVFGRLQEKAVKVAFLGKESPVFSVVLSSDGRTALIKSEYNHHGELIDCDLIDKAADVDRFTAHVDENIQKALGESKEARQDGHRHRMEGRDVFDLDAQVKACERLLHKHQEQDDEEQPGKRTKRSYLIWPGTNWCGKGSKAEFAESYGPNKETDQCCQKHDQCPYIIEGFSTRYNLFNYRIHTLSHCDCDVPFMNCLKAANTSTSNMVGKVYFNVVNTECFDLNLQKSCAKRSWWGGCEKYTTKWTASIRSLGNFPEP